MTDIIFISKSVVMMCCLVMLPLATQEDTFLHFIR